MRRNCIQVMVGHVPVGGGLQGTTPETVKFTGYGIHGTVEPQSIGKQMSMGCVRLGDAEVQVVYELIGESSTIVIR